MRMAQGYAMLIQMVQEGSRMSKVHTVSEDLLESNCETRCLSTNVSSSRRQCGFDAFSLCSEGR